MDETPNNTSRNVIVTIIAIIVIAGLVAAAVAAAPDKKSNTATTTPTTTSDNTTDSSASDSGSSSSSATYKDGSYTATGAYDSPGGHETITIKVTLKDGAVTDTSATSGAQDEEAVEYQGQFIGGYKQQVVGKSIADLHLSHVSGSSLTSQGFNDAIDQIKSQAQA